MPRRRRARSAGPASLSCRFHFSQAQLSLYRVGLLKSSLTHVNLPCRNFPNSNLDRSAPAWRRLPAGNPALLGPGQAGGAAGGRRSQQGLAHPAQTRGGGRGGGAGGGRHGARLAEESAWDLGGAQARRLHRPDLGHDVVHARLGHGAEAQETVGLVDQRLPAAAQPLHVGVQVARLPPERWRGGEGAMWWGPRMKVACSTVPRMIPALCLTQQPRYPPSIPPSHHHRGSLCHAHDVVVQHDVHEEALGLRQRRSAWSSVVSKGE